MEIKKFFKGAAKKGAEQAGKTVIKSIFDPKTWLILYMTILASKAYNKLGDALNREAKINQRAAETIEERVSTPEGMKEVCQEYHLTDEQVHEVINTQKELSNTQKAVMKTAQDSKKSWRDWLPGAGRLRAKGVQDGLDLTARGQAALAMDAYEMAEKELSKTNTAARAAANRGAKR